MATIPILFEFNQLSNQINFDALLTYPTERFNNDWESEVMLSGGYAIATHQSKRVRSYSIGLLLGATSGPDRYIEPEIQTLISFQSRKVLMGFTWADFRFAPAVISSLEVERLTYRLDKCVQAQIMITLDQMSIRSFGGK